MHDRICYKLTDQKGQTCNGTQWGEHITHTTSGDGELCGPGWLHAYDSPYVAVINNPIHADITTPRLWLARWDGTRKDDSGHKFGATSLTTIRELPLPVLTDRALRLYAVRCALEVAPFWKSSPRFPAWRAWALAVITGTTPDTAAWDAARAAARRAAWEAAQAARGAAWAAWDAAWDGWGAGAAGQAARGAAWQAAWEAAAWEADPRILDFARFAREAVTLDAYYTARGIT